LIYGYAGKIALVDLSQQKVEEKELDQEVVELFIGGKGFLYYYGYKNIPPASDPLDPYANRLVVAAGGLAAHAPGASKTGFLAKSPLTRILCDTYAGQVFASKLRMAGYDVLIVYGRSPEPVYLYVENGRIEVRQASHLWGSYTWDTWMAVREETRRGASVAAIGPAGENRVRYANIMVDGFRAAGRCGLGAVMGSMNLKAIAVWGSIQPARADGEGWRKRFVQVYRELREEPSARAWARYGTNDGVSTCARLSMCPAWHWRRPWLSEDEAEKLSGDTVLSRQVPVNVYSRYAGVVWGWACPLKCSKLVSPRVKGLEHIVVKPEYENLAMLGLNPGIMDVDKVLYIQWLVNNLGMDSISYGETVSWLAELVETGVIEPSKLPQPSPSPGFSNPDYVIEAAKLTAQRRGVGAVLAEGEARAAKILGAGENVAVHVKGLEAPAWDPRGRRGLAISYATADIGASHLRGWPPRHEPPSKGPAKDTVADMLRDRDWKALLDSLGLCSFIPYTPAHIEELYAAVTGVRRKAEEMMLVGWRTEALARIHSALAGLTPSQDTIPGKWMEPIPQGPRRGERAVRDERDLEEAIREYYRLRGYHPVYGVPLPETLRKLGLDWAVSDAKKALEAMKQPSG